MLRPVQLVAVAVASVFVVFFSAALHLVKEVGLVVGFEHTHNAHKSRDHRERLLLLPSQLGSRFAILASGVFLPAGGRRSSGFDGRGGDILLLSALLTPAD